MSKHKPIPKKKRIELHNKFNHKCVYCGCDLEYKDMQVDHVKSVYANLDIKQTMTEQEMYDISNLLPTCRQCNFYKSTMTLEDFRNTLTTTMMNNLQKNFNYRLALKYGLVKEHIEPIRFYFETLEFKEVGMNKENEDQKMYGVACKLLDYEETGLEPSEVENIVEKIAGENLVEPEVAEKEIFPQMEKKNYCYSWNGEDFYGGFYESEAEAIKDAKLDKPEASQVWIGIAVRPKLKWNSNEEEIIESMQENLDEDCGEYAESGLDSITNEQELDLAEMINEAVGKWIKKHNIKPSCYTVNDCRLHQLN